MFTLLSLTEGLRSKDRILNLSRLRLNERKIIVGLLAIHLKRLWVVLFPRGLPLEQRDREEFIYVDWEIYFI